MVMFKFPSNSMWRIWTLHYCHLTINVHASTIAQICYFIIWHVFIDSWQVQPLPKTYLLLLCQELTTVTHCSLVLLIMWHPNVTDTELCSSNNLSISISISKSDNITTHLKSIHWLHVKVRSTYRIACLCYHCHNNSAPSYVTGMPQKKPSLSRNTRNSSHTMPLLNKPAHSKASLGDRSFSFASSYVWNSMPNDITCAPLPSSL